MAIKILKMIRRGKKTTDAMIFGKIRYDAVFTPFFLRASICSLMR